MPRIEGKTRRFVRFLDDISTSQSANICAYELVLISNRNNDGDRNHNGCFYLEMAARLEDCIFKKKIRDSFANFSYLCIKVIFPPWFWYYFQAHFDLASFYSSWIVKHRITFIAALLPDSRGSECLDVWVICLVTHTHFWLAKRLLH